MNFKQFLKPEIKKVILAFLIFLVMPLPVLRTAVLGMCPLNSSSEGSCGGDGYYYEWNFIPFGVITVLTIPSVNLEMIVYNYMFNFLFLAIISYLLSCLIIWIYDKIKVKKK